MTRHRVVIDTRTVVDRASGIGNYVSALVKHMVPLAEDLHFLLLRHPRSEGWLFEHPRVDELRFRGETKSLSTIAMGRLLRFEEQDLYHGPADIVPPGIACPSVVTLHDLMWVEKPHLAASFGPARWLKGAFYRHYFHRSVVGASRVIAISQATSDAIAQVWPDQANKVSVVHHGVDHDRYRPSQVGARRDLEKIVPPGSPYALIVGQGSPYKNHVGMIRAFIEATADHPDHKLVVVRRFSRVDLQMRRLLAHPDVRRRVITLPFVDDQTLLTLLGHARMLLFVSHYEGFGMPPLEAFAMGTPVLGSTAPAVAEITDRAALRADPSDHADMVAKMRALLYDDGLCQELSAKGKARAAEFTWDKCARQTLEVYRAALRSPQFPPIRGKVPPS